MGLNWCRMRGTAAAVDVRSIFSGDGGTDFLIRNNGDQVPVSELVGKSVLLYFSAHWCPPCRGFTPILIRVYDEIKARGCALEVVFVSSDSDQSSFEEYFSGMPWLALPFGDKRGTSLSRKFKVTGIPSLVAIGPSGRTVTTEARGMVAVHGSAAYPFTQERIKQLEKEVEDMAKGWPKKVKHGLHPEHELVLTRQMIYGCDACGEEGRWWSFCCKRCNLDLHPKCALKVEEKGEGRAAGEEGTTVEGYTCDGGVCRKA